MKVFKDFEDVYKGLKTFKGMKFNSYHRLGNFLLCEQPNGIETRKVYKDNPENMEKINRILNIIKNMYNILNNKPVGSEKGFINKVKVDLYMLVKTVQSMVQA